MEWSYIIIGGIALFASVYVVVLGMIILHLSSMLFGAPYVPSKDENVDKALRFFKETDARRLADLGSGDGRILMRLAKIFEQVSGYEVNPIMAWKSRKNIKKAGLKKKIHIYRGSFFQYDLSSYDAIYIYGISYIMKRLERKLLRELESGAVVVTCGFHFPNWKPIKRDGPVWLYVKE